MTIALLWLTAAVAGVFEFHNYRRFAAFAMVVTLLGFTFEVYRPQLPELEAVAEPKEYVGLSVGGLYHVNSDPACRLLRFTTNDPAGAAERAGWEPCPECVSAQEAGSHHAAEESRGESHHSYQQGVSASLVHEHSPTQ